KFWILLKRIIYCYFLISALEAEECNSVNYVESLSFVKFLKFNRKNFSMTRLILEGDISKINLIRKGEPLQYENFDINLITFACNDKDRASMEYALDLELK
ncbi:unnamed protein product, partial [Heterotrigona itama]